MKQPLLYFLTSAFVSITILSPAQVTLTSGGINPVVGESFTLFTTTSSISPGSPGASQTWNLSSMSGTTGGITNIVAPSSTPNGASFPASNVAWNNATGGTNYLGTSATALKFYGVATSTVIPYSNPEDFLHFPFTLNDTYVDAFAGSYVSSGYTWYRRGTATVTADGYGTLITPSGTYSNVLRVHFVEAYQDSTNFGTPYIISTNSDQYRWYKNGIHIEIAQLFTLTTSTGASYAGGAYITGSVGLSESSALINSSALYPNPASDRITINFNLTESKTACLQVYNAMGQKADLSTVVNATQGLNTVNFDVTMLPAGIYLAEIILDGNTVATKQFVVSK